MGFPAVLLPILPLQSRQVSCVLFTCKSIMYSNDLPDTEYEKSETIESVIALLCQLKIDICRQRED